MRWLWGISALCWSTTLNAGHLVMYTEHFPPYSFEKDHYVTGLNTELVRRSCQLAGLQCDFYLLPWLRAYEAAQKTSNAGLYSTSRNPLRESSFQWVGPLAHASANMYWLRSRDEPAPRSLEEAKEFIVAVARGDVYELYLQSQGFIVDVNLLRFNAKSDAVLPFLHGKIDLLIASDLILPGWLAQHNVDVDAVAAVIDLSAVGQNYLALNKAIPAEQVLRLQNALDQLKASGEYHVILEAFLRPSDSHSSANKEHDANK